MPGKGGGWGVVVPHPPHLSPGWEWVAVASRVPASLERFSSFFSLSRILNLRGGSLGRRWGNLHVNLLGLVLDDGSIISIVSPEGRGAT